MPFSPAFRWGLIEAFTIHLRDSTVSLGFPRHFAGASLKQVPDEFRALQIAGGFPRHFAGASLKRIRSSSGHGSSLRFPRHFAGASLKPMRTGAGIVQASVFPGISLGPH